MGFLLTLPSCVHAREAPPEPAAVDTNLVDVNARYPVERYIVAEGISDISRTAAEENARTRITQEIRSYIKVDLVSTTSSSTVQRAESYQEKLEKNVRSSAQSESARLARPLPEHYRFVRGRHYAILVLDRVEAAADLERRYTFESRKFGQSADLLEGGQIRKEARLSTEEQLDHAIEALLDLGRELESVARKQWTPMHEDLTRYNALKASLAAPIKRGSVVLTQSGLKGETSAYDLRAWVQSCIEPEGWQVLSMSDDPTHYRLDVSVGDDSRPGPLPVCAAILRVTGVAPMASAGAGGIAHKFNLKVPGITETDPYYREAACRKSLEALLRTPESCPKLRQALDQVVLPPQRTAGGYVP